ncbi:MAG: ACT domain-containing protein [Desulfovibrionaceae bacterium]|nr:ACT domain-containing protein [Desulfovibrionaceae bacterium]
MKVEQLVVFLENRAGRVADVTHALAEAKINIQALSLADTSNFGILRLLVGEQEKAKNVLKEKGFTTGTTNVVAVLVDDKPGALDHVLQIVSAHGINVEYMYSLIQRERPGAVMIFRFDKNDQAIEALTETGAKILSGPELFPGH